MIKIQTLEVSGLRGAFRALREPLMSHDKSDSYTALAVAPGNGTALKQEIFVPGPKDLELAMKLAKAGPDHGKFLRMIKVQAEITAPAYWWATMDTYKVGTVRVSSSLMHSLGKVDMRQTIDDAIPVKNYGFGLPVEVATSIMIAKKHITETLNILQKYSDDTKCFELMRQLMPSGYLYTSVWDANYQTLRTIYHQRKNHKLSEWSGPDGFCRWVETLPYSGLITSVQNNYEPN